jgi:hypothetical protein
VGIDPTDFTRQLIGFYEPELYRLLFGEKNVGR